MTTDEIKPGDVVQVIGGRYDGCVLTLVSITPLGEYICQLSTGDMRFQKVRKMRPGTY